MLGAPIDLFSIQGQIQYDMIPKLRRDVLQTRMYFPTAKLDAGHLWAVHTRYVECSVGSGCLPASRRFCCDWDVSSGPPGGPIGAVPNPTSSRILHRRHALMSRGCKAGIAEPTSAIRAAVAVSAACTLLSNWVWGGGYPKLGASNRIKGPCRDLHAGPRLTDVLATSQSPSAAHLSYSARCWRVWGAHGVVRCRHAARQRDATVPQAARMVSCSAQRRAAETLSWCMLGTWTSWTGTFKAPLVSALADLTRRKPPVFQLRATEHAIKAGYSCRYVSHMVVQIRANCVRKVFKGVRAAPDAGAQRGSHPGMQHLAPPR